MATCAARVLLADRCCCRIGPDDRRGLGAMVISIFLCLTRSLGTLEECSRTLPETPG